MIDYNSQKKSNITFVKGPVDDASRHKGPSKKRFWSNKFIEFCKRTDLHGYKYIVMEDFNNVERFV